MVRANRCRPAHGNATPAATAKDKRLRDYDLITVFADERRVALNVSEDAEQFSGGSVNRAQVRAVAEPSTPSSRLGMGFIALGLLLVSEFTLVLGLQGLTISDYLLTRDPVSGTVYYVMIGVFGIIPLLVARK